MVAHAEHDHGFWACSFLFWFWGLDATCVYQLQTTPLLQVYNAFGSSLIVLFVACTARPA